MWCSHVCINTDDLTSTVMFTARVPSCGHVLTEKHMTVRASCTHCHICQVLDVTTNVCSFSSSTHTQSWCFNRPGVCPGLFQKQVLFPLPLVVGSWRGRGGGYWFECLLCSRVGGFLTLFLQIKSGTHSTYFFIGYPLYVVLFCIIKA